MATQSYYLEGKIRAIDYNGFADDINEIVGMGAGDSGYGQSHLVIPHVASGVKNKRYSYAVTLTALKFAGRHQGTTIITDLILVSPVFICKQSYRTNSKFNDRYHQCPFE